MEDVMPVRKNSQSGFSMIEMLVAIMILMVGLLGLAQLQITAIKANSQSATATAATAISQRFIEEITAMDQDDPMFDADGTGTFPSVAVAGAGTYSVTWTVDAEYEDVTNLCKATIVVASTTEVMGVLGSDIRTVTVSTLKRAL
jgi:type IV pilus modification protein PilV